MTALSPKEMKVYNLQEVKNLIKQGKIKEAAQQTIFNAKDVLIEKNKTL